MKKYFGLIVSSVLLLSTSVFATYEDFSNQLETMGLDVKAIASQNSIARYDVARLLNIVECKDCINPNQDMINAYVQNFRSAFISSSGADFTDITFGGGIYKETSYYYCVAYVGDNTYMRGYPQATSPICGGKFCGTQNTTTAEFLQVVTNIIAKYIYKDITLNRDTVNKRIKSVQKDSYEAKNFSTTERNIITQRSQNCQKTCVLQNSNEVQIYLKYCMFNLNKCNMQEFGKIKQGYRPVAELNILKNQSIIDIDKSIWTNTDKAIDGATVLETLFKLNSKIDCAFNNDYDCDGLRNADDSCPNAYNPKQKDTDSDLKGDVCDEDIDGDTIQNPIGIVDDEGKINIGKWTGNIDNCLFTPNTGQQDSNQNGIGDTCENQDDQLGIYISINDLKGSAPVTTIFSAITQGRFQKILRNFGDGTQAEGKEVTHTFMMPGMYNVQAILQGETSNVQANTIVIVGGNRENDTKALQAKTNRIGGASNTESIVSVSTVGEFDEIQRSFPNEKFIITKTADEKIQKIFKTPGEHPVIIKGYNKGILAGISYFTIGISEGKGAILKSNTINPEINQKILLDTQTYHIQQSDILSVQRDFGDSKKITNTTLTMEYSYKKAGKKVITQTITLVDGTRLNNGITINIVDSTAANSYALIMEPSTLKATIGENILFTTRIVGNMVQTPLIHLFQFADGTTQKKGSTEKMPNTFSHSYQKNGFLTPETSLYIDQCTYLKNQATIAINSSDRCLIAKLEKRLNSSYTCDMDKDGIPDMCDDDIDGDGIKNLIGLINFEDKDCFYSDNNLNKDLLKKHYKEVCSLDNAPFIPNNDQLDLNQDGIGDIQITTGNNNDTIDTDSDGIPDYQDLCVTIQETWNGVSDEDGCPEIGQEINCKNDNTAITNDTIIITPIQCNQCPCQFTDYASDLTNNDQIRAILRDNKKTIQYKFSLPWIVEW